MSLPGVELKGDRAELVSLVDALVAHHGVEAPADDAPALADVKRALVDAGLWTLAVSERSGGGGAPFELYLVALAELGRWWPALAWEIAQVHAMADLLAETDGQRQMLTEVLEGGSASVVGAASDLVHLSETDGQKVSGSIDRIDPCDRTTHLLLVGSSESWLFMPRSLTLSPPVRRAGLAGAGTCSVEIDGSIGLDCHRVSTPSGSEALARLGVSGAAIAAGLAYEAAGRAAEYAKSRVQFGQPLTSLPTVRLSLARQAGSAATSLAATLALDFQDPIAAAATLEHNCGLAVDTAAAAVQSLGGYGYLAEYGVERVLRDAVSLSAATAAAANVRRAAYALTPKLP